MSALDNPLARWGGPGASVEAGCSSSRQRHEREPAVCMWGVAIGSHGRTGELGEHLGEVGEDAEVTRRLAHGEPGGRDAVAKPPAVGRLGHEVLVAIPEVDGRADGGQVKLPSG